MKPTEHDAMKQPERETMGGRKYRIKQISSNSLTAKLQTDDLNANLILKNIGFEPKTPSVWGDCAYIGSVPNHGKDFYVYYQEPISPEVYLGGTFRLVRKDGEEETLLDQGIATKSHIHGGLGTLTFYAQGKKLNSWSFHCEPEEIKL